MQHTLNRHAVHSAWGTGEETGGMGVQGGGTVGGQVRGAHGGTGGEQSMGAGGMGDRGRGQVGAHCVHTLHRNSHTHTTLHHTHTYVPIEQ